MITSEQYWWVLRGRNRYTAKCSIFIYIVCLCSLTIIYNGLLKWCFYVLFIHHPWWSIKAYFNSPQVTISTLKINLSIILLKWNMCYSSLIFAQKQESLYPAPRLSGSISPGQRQEIHKLTSTSVAELVIFPPRSVTFPRSLQPPANQQTHRMCSNRDSCAKS